MAEFEVFQKLKEKVDSQDEPNTGVKKQYIFGGSSLEVQYFYIIISLFVSKHKLSDACAKDLLKLFSIVLPQPNKV
jgi:hypothetical protein